GALGPVQGVQQGLPLILQDLAAAGGGDGVPVGVVGVARSGVIVGRAVFVGLRELPDVALVARPVARAVEGQQDQAQGVGVAQGLLGGVSQGLLAGQRREGGGCQG